MRRPQQLRILYFSLFLSITVVGVYILSTHSRAFSSKHLLDAGDESKTIRNEDTTNVATTGTPGAPYFGYNKDAWPHLSESQKLLPDEVVLILKTGQSTPALRLRGQLETFASAKFGRTQNNTIIISDAEQTVEAAGTHWNVTDVINDLSNVQDVSTSDKFKIYLQQKEKHASGITTQTRDPPGSNNNGWTLDALKFIPGYHRAAQQFPNAKWFIGLDDDNYLHWDSVLAFLSLLDHQKKWYIGSPAYLVANQVKFMHGGSVTISSQASMKARFIDGAADLDKFNKDAVELCCGDGVLAMAYAASGILPDEQYREYFNGESMQNTRVRADNYCLPLMGLHHLEGLDIINLDEAYEHEVKNEITTWGSYLEAVANVTSAEAEVQFRANWDYGRIGDNSEKIAVSFAKEKTAELCRATCDENADKCLTWTFLLDQEECWLSPFATAGEASSGRTAGLNTNRLRSLRDNCDNTNWKESVLTKAKSKTN